MCWPKTNSNEDETIGEKEGEENGGIGSASPPPGAELSPLVGGFVPPPEFADEDAAAVVARAGGGARVVTSSRCRATADDGPMTTTHVLATPVETAGGAVRCCLVASREGGRSFSRAEVEALAVFAGHVGLCMD